MSNLFEEILTGTERISSNTNTIHNFVSETMDTA